MKRIRTSFWHVAHPRAIVESWLVCTFLLVPLLPVFLESTPLARSLYLSILPLACALFAGFRAHMFDRFSLRELAREGAWALLLSGGVLGIVFGLIVSLGQMDSIKYSYFGTNVTILFLLFAAPEYLGVRIIFWGWRFWNRLRRRHFAWALTHAILMVMGVIDLLVLIGVVVFLVYRLGGDIWQIPPQSPFAQILFWLAVILLLSVLIFTSGVVLFLPPATFFSFRIARNMTVRLEKLAAMTQALRQGNLTVRVRVIGEDEITQLQTNFNAMAADLEKLILELQAEKDKVWALMEARRELVNGISHELRNPVAIIQGYSDSLRNSYQNRSPVEVERDLETIQYETTRLQTILNDLLTASQIEAGRLNIAVQQVDITSLVSRLVETFSPLAWGSKRVQVTHPPLEKRILGLADPLRLEQALVNLVQNAVRHTPAGGLVTVELGQDAEYILIDVQDTGEGILPEDLPHIWDKYYQVDASQHRASGGMGLGLSLVKELIEGMDGIVTVASQPGEGSMFTIRLKKISFENL